MLITMLKDFNELVEGEGLAQALADYIGDIICRDKVQAVKDEVTVRYTAVVIKGCHNGNLISIEAGVASLVGGQVVKEFAVLGQHLVHVVELSGGKPLQRVLLVYLGVKVEAKELEVGGERYKNAVKAQSGRLEAIAGLGYIKHIVHIYLSYLVNIKNVSGRGRGGEGGHQLLLGAVLWLSAKGVGNPLLVSLLYLGVYKVRNADEAVEAISVMLNINGAHVVKQQAARRVHGLALLVNERGRHSAAQYKG